MKLVHNVTISVFCKEHEDEQKIHDGLLFLLGMDESELKKQKLKINRKSAQGFNEKKIIIFTVIIDKQRHTKLFLKNLVSLLASGQRKIIATEAKNHLDDGFFFFIRFEKDAIIKDKKLMLTDSGKCYHVKMSIAAFPKSRDAAFKVVESIFSEDLNNEETA